jgi:hypothetical protein
MREAPSAIHSAGGKVNKNKVAIVYLSKFLDAKIKNSWLKQANFPNELISPSFY